jgi:hypothetical protein
MDRVRPSRVAEAGISLCLKSVDVEAAHRQPVAVSVGSGADIERQRLMQRLAGWPSPVSGSTPSLPARASRPQPLATSIAAPVCPR